MRMRSVLLRWLAANPSTTAVAFQNAFHVTYEQDARSSVLRSSVRWLRMVTQLFAEPFDTTSRERYQFRT